MTKKQKKARDAYLKRKYNMSLEQYGVMLKAQRGRCAICGNKPKTRSLHVDHDHNTGIIRGLLCYRCNYGFGFFRYTRSIYNGLISYVTNVLTKMKGGK